MRLIEYVDGIPVAKTHMVIPRSQFDNILLAAASLEYEGDSVTGEPEPEYVGLTNIEVAAIRHAKRAASGDGEAFRYVMDRIAGKAKQAIETTNVNMSLAEYLKAMNDLNDGEPQDAIQHLNLKTITTSLNDINLDDEL